MSDTSQGPGWWLASDGKWYPPELHPGAAETHHGSSRPEGPGWWLASDGRWYAPELHPGTGSEAHPAGTSSPRAADWWLASDGRWYPPELHPDVLSKTTADVPEPTAAEESGSQEQATATTTIETEPTPEPELVPDEPAALEPEIEEPVAEEPVAEEPVFEEPVFEEPVVEEPVVEEPVVEEPVVEEPVVEEPVVEEPELAAPIAAVLAAVAPPTAEAEAAEQAPRETTDPISEEPAVVGGREEYPGPEDFSDPDGFFVPSSEPPTAKKRRRRVVEIVVVLVLLGAAVAGVVVAKSSPNKTGASRPPVISTTTSTPAAPTGWTLSALHVIGGPVLAGTKVVVLDAAANGAMELVAVNPVAGTVAWHTPFSASAVSPSVLLTPVVAGGLVLDLAPTGAPTAPTVNVEAIDPATGHARWTLPSAVTVIDAPTACGTPASFCVDVTNGSGTSTLARVDPATGTVTANTPGPATEIADGLYQLQASPASLAQVSSTGSQVWSKPVASLFGGSQYSTQYGWNFVNAGPLDVGTVGIAPSGNSEPLQSLKTLGISAVDGSVRWSDPGALGCFGVLPVTTPFLCRYSAPGTYVDNTLSTAATTLTLQGVNPATGQVAWSVPLSDAQAMTTGSGVAILDATHIVVPLSAGPALLDLATGQTAALPTGVVLWCGAVQQASVQAAPAALSAGHRVAVTLFTPCTPQGAGAAGAPTHAVAGLGVTIDGMFVWPSSGGLVASPTPR